MTSIPSGAPRRYAVIPTHNRHDMLRELVTEIAAQVDAVLIVDNASTPEVRAIDIIHEVGDGRPRGSVFVMRDERQPPNLSELWQRGLAWVARDAFALDAWDVAILNDDVRMHVGWFEHVAGPMREHGAAAACSMPVRAPHMETSGKRPRVLYGPAFVIRGELATKPGDPLWPDERLEWWGGDTLMDIRAQQNGGTLIVPGPVIENVHANESTVGALAEQAGRDRETFKEIVGWYGW